MAPRLFFPRRLTEMNYTLSIDRSTPHGSWALFGNGTMMESASFEEALPRSPTWFPAILQGLAVHGLAPRDIGEYIVGTGPGSFSGIRAVIAALQGLALPESTPVLGVQSAAALAFAESKREGAASVTIVGDARRGTLWLAAFDFTAATAATVAAPPSLVKAGELAAHIRPGALVVSPEYTKLAAALEDAAAQAGAKTISHDGVVTAEDVARLYLAYPAAAVRDPLPVYLHPAV